MLKVRDIYRGFDQKKVLQGVRFQLPTSSIAGLIGPSGGGKSTLLKIIGGVARADSGSVSFNGIETSQRSVGDSKVALMFQEGALFDSLSVLDNVAFPLVQGKVPVATLPKDRRDEVVASVEAILVRVGLAKAASKMPAQLSGGMRRRVSLARALVSRPDLVLLDDPTSGLDPVASSVIMDLISELHRDYLPTTLMVSHDLRRLIPVVDTVLALFNGRLIFMGNVEELRATKSEELFRFVSCRYELERAEDSADRPQL